MTNRHLDEIKRKMENMQQQGSGRNNTSQQKKVDGEYIDYEEVK